MGKFKKNKRGNDATGSPDMRITSGTGAGGFKPLDFKEEAKRREKVFKELWGRRGEIQRD